MEKKTFYGWSSRLCSTGGRQNFWRHLQSALRHQEDEERGQDRGQVLQRDVGQRDADGQEQREEPRAQRPHLHREDQNLRLHGDSAASQSFHTEQVHAAVSQMNRHCSTHIYQWLLKLSFLPTSTKADSLKSSGIALAVRKS